jgi:hypothetical protein
VHARNPLCRYEVLRQAEAEHAHDLRQSALLHPTTSLHNFLDDTTLTTLPPIAGDDVVVLHVPTHESVGLHPHARYLPYVFPLPARLLSPRLTPLSPPPLDDPDRDIKPQNIIVDPATGQLKLIDFGSAKVITVGQPNVSYIASRYYRAPEAIFGATDYTVAIGASLLPTLLKTMSTLSLCVR